MICKYTLWKLCCCYYYDFFFYDFFFFLLVTEEVLFFSIFLEMADQDDFQGKNQGLTTMIKNKFLLSSYEQLYR